jgi:hypothetical protein
VAAGAEVVFGAEGEEVIDVLKWMTGNRDWVFFLTEYRQELWSRSVQMQSK